MADKRKSFWGEFKEFISRGNVMDLAVGLIIGSAFTAIVNSLVNDIVMPVVGVIIGGINFSELKWVITPATETTPEAALCYGAFIQNIVNFLLIAFVVFCMIRIINRFHRKKEEPAAPAPSPAPSEEVVLLTEIRDLMAAERELYQKTEKIN